MAHLWTPTSKRAAPPPAIAMEQLVFAMCRAYHCTPSQLEGEDWEQVLIHWEILNAERAVDNRRKEVQADVQKRQAARQRAMARPRKR